MPVFNAANRLNKLPNDKAWDYICDGLIIAVIFAICLISFFWWDDHRK